MTSRALDLRYVVVLVAAFQTFTTLCFSILKMSMMMLRKHKRLDLFANMFLEQIKQEALKAMTGLSGVKVYKKGPLHDSRVFRCNQGAVGHC